MLDPKVALGPVLNARAVHDMRVDGEVRNNRNLEVHWRRGRVERLRRAVIAVFAARGWRMGGFLLLLNDSEVDSGNVWKGAVKEPLARNWSCGFGRALKCSYVLTQDVGRIALR